MTDADSFQPFVDFAKREIHGGHSGVALKTWFGFSQGKRHRICFLTTRAENLEFCRTTVVKDKVLLWR